MTHLNPHYKPKKTFWSFFAVELAWTALGLALCGGALWGVSNNLSPEARARVERDFPPAAQFWERRQAQQQQQAVQQAEQQRLALAQAQKEQQAATAKANRLPQLTDAPNSQPDTFWGRIGQKRKEWWGKSGSNGVKQ